MLDTKLRIHSERAGVKASHAFELPACPAALRGIGAMVYCMRLVLLFQKKRLKLKLARVGRPSRFSTLNHIRTTARSCVIGETISIQS